MVLYKVNHVYFPEVMAMQSGRGAKGGIGKGKDSQPQHGDLD